ncbi:hypothetical protein CHLRE_05g246050v5 [Chlamydomonas reinhardtii]|uniref:OTU domain-containing protein n=1 Tax=Chlamydomonas reinhardtii TaxID=3055 RepID=A0A2K3DS59_CHLRE|nr:uncharacterized protein CHLRE_05g246050v5 [Chlamydomonas reinhardtii]PNW83370.1 hypothetical protein CHLRE_05g246050v5 [Chlamydomonas reinhardtii]
MAKKEKITVKKIDDAKKAKKGSEEKEAKPAKGKGKDGKGKDRSKWAAHEADLETELAALGLRIKDITGDGNCFFRALGDQLKGEEKVHAELRARIVGFMADHEEEFAPFVEDDESFGSYVARMKKDGTWAGYMEVVAASRCLGANLTIYQAGQPRWRVVHHPEDTAPMLHLAYSDGQHYDSVRCADDYGHGPAAPVVIRGDGTVPARPQRPVRDAGSEPWDERDEARVAASTACRDLGLVRAALSAAGGDVEAAVEKVIEMLAEQAEAEEGAEEVGEKEEKEVKEEGAGKEAEPGGEGGVSDVASITNGAGDGSGGGGAGGGGGGGSGGNGEAATGARPPDAEPKVGRGGEMTSAGAAVAGAAAAEAAAAGEAAGPAPAPAEARVPSTALRETDADAASATAASAAGAAVATATAATATAATATADPATSATAPSSSTTGPGGASADATGGAGEPAPGEAKGAGRKAPDSAKRRGIVVGSRSSSSSSSAAAAGSSSAPANNKRCPCGSNKKYKACCGPAAAAAARRKAAAGEVEVEAAAGLGTTVVAQVAALVI